MKPIYKPTFFLPLAAFASLALPGLGSSILLAPASITVDATQCEVQTCGSFPHNTTYSGPLSGFSGPVFAGEGISVSATGFPFPTLTSTVPLSGANAIIDAELTYLIEVVPNDGSSTVAPVQIGVNAVGSDFATTIGLENSANADVELALLSDSSGTPVFDDAADILYNPGMANGICVPGNSSNTRGAGFISPAPLGTAGINCGGSSVSGGFNETGSYSISSNLLYEVVMNETVTVGTGNNGLGQGPGTVQGNSFIDPIFTVPNGYQLELSSGVGNSNAAPEPGAWMLVAAGLALLAFTRVIRASASTR